MRWLRALVLSLCLLCVGLVWHSAQAATLTDFTVRMDRQQVSTYTPITIRFRTPSGINATSDYFNVDFHNTLGDVNVADMHSVRLSYGPTTGLEFSATTGTHQGLGRWGVANDFASILFTPPSDAGVGTIPAGDFVVIQLGVGATAPDQPVMIGPAGNYNVAVYGQSPFWPDSGVAHITMRAADSMDVTATVPVHDVTPPVISGLAAQSITTSAATIVWSTDEPADAYLEYGLTTGYTGGNVTRGTFLTSNSMDLSGLQPDTDYHVHVRARDASSNTTWSSDLVFHTAATPPSSPPSSPSPIISPAPTTPTVFSMTPVLATFVSDHQVILGWTTNQAATGHLNLLTPISRSVADSGSSIYHSIQLNDLAPSTTYTFHAVSDSLFGGQHAARDGSFTTYADVTPPSNVSGFTATLSTGRNVALSWTNPTDADFLDVIVTRVDPATGITTAVCQTTGHTCTNHLPATGSVFEYRAVAEDRSHNQASGAVAILSLLDGTTPSPTLTPTTPTPVPILPPGSALLHVVTRVLNNNGGTATVNMVTVHVQTNLSADVTSSPHAGEVAPGTAYVLPAGQYTVNEEALPGYVLSMSGDCDATGHITLADSDDKTCILTNDDVTFALPHTPTPLVQRPGVLHLVSVVVNRHGGTAYPAAFLLHVKHAAGGDVSGSPMPGVGLPGTPYTLLPGDYSVDENPQTGYTSRVSGDCDASGHITLASNDDKTCLIVSEDIAAAPLPPGFGSLQIVNTVHNDFGGTVLPSAAMIHVRTAAGADVTGSPQAGASAPGTGYALPAGGYAVSEEPFAGYTLTFSGDCDATGHVSLVAGGSKTCDLSNTQNPPTPVLGTGTLRIIKHVVNNNGGTAQASAFILHVKTNGLSGLNDVSGSPASGRESPGTTYTLATGSYEVSEDLPVGYTQTFSGDCDASGNVTLVSSEVKSCLITNDDVAETTPLPPHGFASLTIINNMVNDNGGTGVASDATLHVRTSSGADVPGSPQAGVGVPGTTYTLAPGSYLVDENTFAGYAKSFSLDCAVGGAVTLVDGDRKVCVVTNDDIPGTTLTPTGPTTTSTLITELPLPPVLLDQPTATTTSPVPTATTTPGRIVPPPVQPLSLTPAFYLSDSVIAMPDAQGVRTAIVGRAVQVQVSVIGLSSSLTQADVMVSDGSTYLLSYDPSLGAYVTSFRFDHPNPTRQQVTVLARTADGRSWSGRYPFDVIPLAQVIDSDQPTASSTGVLTTLEVTPIGGTGGTTQTVHAIGGDGFAFVLPNGEYALHVTRDGYRAHDQNVTITNGIFAQTIRLRREPQSIQAIVAAAKSPAALASALVSNGVLVAKIGLDAAQDPQVQAVTQNVAVPTAVVVSASVVATAVSGTAFFNYLWLLITQPLLLLGRRKRKAWGVAYNSLTKQPVELAVVRLVRVGTNFVMQTRITDGQGRFSFLVPPGVYTLQILKPGYAYPSNLLKQDQTDADFVDLYHGEPIVVRERTSISPNVPLDPDVKEETPKAIIRKLRWRKLQSVVGVAGLFAGVAALVIDPSPLMAGFAVFQVATYAMFRRLAIPPKPKRWGIVYDTDGKKPLAKAVVRIFDKKFNKLLETQITSSDGTYGFLAAKSVYYLTAEKAGYERFTSTDINFAQAKDTFIDQRFSLKRVGATSS